MRASISVTEPDLQPKIFRGDAGPDAAAQDAWAPDRARSPPPISGTKTPRVPASEAARAPPGVGGSESAAAAAAAAGWCIFEDAILFFEIMERHSGSVFKVGCRVHSV